MTDAHTERLELLRELLPALFSPPPKRILYVGASKRSGRGSYTDEMLAAGHVLTLLEAWPDNAQYYAHLPDTPFVLVQCGDVRKVDYYRWSGPFDIAFWWHGPEHIGPNELEATLEQLERRCLELIVLGCPWGRYEQGEVDGNPFERHLAYLYPQDFKRLGYSAATLGQRDVPGSCIVAWKELNEDPHRQP